MQLGITYMHRLKRLEQACTKVVKLPGDTLAAPTVRDM